MFRTVRKLSPLIRKSTRNMTSLINKSHLSRFAHKPSFYQRPLPDFLIQFSSPEGKEIFKESLAEGHMEGYFQLAEQYNTQSEPAYCGLGTLVMVLNSLRLDPNRLWKGPWRWFSEEMMDCCVPLETIKSNGITIDHFWCLAKCNGADVKLLRYEKSSEEEFRKYIMEATSTGKFIIVSSFSRSALGQTGDGHFSPIGGYNKKRDLVLLMDVARFKYPAYWVTVKQLWNAMAPHDKVTGRPRGYFIIKKGSSDAALLYKLSLNNKVTWRHITVAMTQIIPEKIIANNPRSVEDTIYLMLKEIPINLHAGLIEYASVLAFEESHCDDVEHKILVPKLMKDISQLKLYAIVKKVIERLRVEFDKKEYFVSYPKACEIATLLILGTPRHTFLTLDPQVLYELDKLRDLSNSSKELQHEVQLIKERLRTMCEFCGAESSCSEDSFSSDCENRLKKPNEKLNEKPNEQCNEILNENPNEKLNENLNENSNEKLNEQFSEKTNEQLYYNENK